MKTKWRAADSASPTCSTSSCSKSTSRTPARKRTPSPTPCSTAKAIDPDEMYEQYAAIADRIAPFVADTALLLNKAIRAGKSVMFEGAQGTMLDIDHGTYPFVTSSSATSGGASIGTGVPPTSIATVIGVTKAYCTRVGEGPFPSEIHGELGEAVRKKGQRIRRRHRTPPPLRMARSAPAALLQHDQRHRMAGRHQARCARRTRRNPRRRRLQNRRQSRRGDPRAGLRLPQNRAHHQNPLPAGRRSPSGPPNTTSSRRKLRTISASFRRSPAPRSAWSPPAPTATTPSSSTSSPPS